MRKFLCIALMFVACCAAINLASHIGGCSEVEKGVEATNRFDASTIQKSSTHVYQNVEGNYTLYRVNGATVFCSDEIVVYFNDDGSVESSMPMDNWYWLCINEGQKRCARFFPNFNIPGAWAGYCACFNAAIANCDVLILWMGGHLS